LILARTDADFIVGESTTDPYWDGDNSAPLKNPMMLKYTKKVIPSKVHGQPPQEVTQFEFVPLSCGEINVLRVCYWGEVKKHDAVFIMYHKVLAAQKTQEQSPLMVEQ